LLKCARPALKLFSAAALLALIYANAAASLPEALLRTNRQGLAISFIARSGARETILVPGDLIATQLTAVDEARASLSGRELQWAAILKLPLGSAEPVPRASAVSKNLFRKRGNTGEAYSAIRFFPA